MPMLLERAANLSLAIHNGVSLLHCAAGDSHAGCVRALLARGADVNARGT
jgi:ankyrin repeat protein